MEYQKSWWHLEIVISNNFISVFACSFSVLSNLLHKSFIDDILHTTHKQQSQLTSQLQNLNGHLIGHNLSQHFQIQSITTRPLGQQDAKKPNCCRDLSKSCKSSYLWTCDPAWGALACVGDMHTQGIFTLVTILSKRLRVLVQTCTIHKTVNLDRCSRQTSFLQAWWMHYKSIVFDQQSPADVWASKLPYPGKELGTC